MIVIFAYRLLDVVPRHVDTAQAYRNEDAVGAAARESGLQRADFFIGAQLLTPHRTIKYSYG